MNNISRNIMLWVVILILVVVMFQMFEAGGSGGARQQIDYTSFLSKVSNGQIESVVIQGGEITATEKGGIRYRTQNPGDLELTNRLLEADVRIEVEPPESGRASPMNTVLMLLAIGAMVALFVFFMRQMNSGGNRAMGFGKSRAKLLTEKHGRVTFTDVAGVDEAKSELEEIVEFLRDPHKFQRLGGKIPKGVLLVGPPGTGKTLLARAIAGEANVPFFTISGSDFVEMFVGVGASRVRDMFEQGKKNAPCIIFIDEIDAVGRHRGAGLGGGNDEREQTLNQLLVEMDGFEANEGVILIAATNRPDVLDPALLRPGRFDRQVTVPNPDVLGREKILRVHMSKVQLGPDVDPKVIARGTPGFSGADLANLVNEAALWAARNNKRSISMADFEYAKDKVMMGPERKSMKMSDAEREMTAYHEAGHALVAAMTPNTDPIHKATIVPRGRALGMVMQLPEEDKLSMKRNEMLARLDVAAAGRVAEEVIYGDDKVSAGAASDIQQMTAIARAMVTEWGMSDKIGMIRYAGEQQDPFLGAYIGRSNSQSDHTAKVIEEEMRGLVDTAYSNAKRLLTENIDKLHAIAKALIEFETLSGNDIHKLLKGEEIDRKDDMEGFPPAGAPGGGRRGSVPTGGIDVSKPSPGGEPGPQPT